MSDPARATILPWEERRKKYREGCREMPCGSAMNLDPACAVCANEGEAMRARIQGLTRLRAKEDGDA